MRVKDDWCPLCFERIAPAIRTVSPRSLGDDRVVSLRAGIARSSGTALVAVSLVVLFAFATRRDPRGAWLPALMAIVFILCAGVGCWLLLRRQWLVALPERRRWRVEFAARAVAVVATMIVTIAMIAWKAFART